MRARRPTTLDFIDVERIEVLRGPQGTLFGKNTTAGAILVTTRRPSFTRSAEVEASLGSEGFQQAKASITGPLSDTVATRLSFSGTRRDGLLRNVLTGRKTNELDNLGVRAQVLVLPSDDTEAVFAVRLHPPAPRRLRAGARRRGADLARHAGLPFVPLWHRPESVGQSAPPLLGIISDLGYTPPNVDLANREVRPFDRVIDTGTPWRSDNTLGGASLNLETALGAGTLTSTRRGASGTGTRRTTATTPRCAWPRCRKRRPGRRSGRRSCAGRATCPNAPAPCSACSPSRNP